MIAQPQITPAGDGQVDLSYRIDEGVQSYVNMINVQGKTKTKDKVIRRELAVQPGGIFDTTLVDVSKTRLMNLNYFSKVDMAPQDTLVPGRKDLDVIVEEKKTGSFNFGAGFSSLDSLVGFAFREVGPKDQYGNPVGGNTSVFGTGELTFPIIPRLRGAFFSDWGFVNADSWAFNPAQVTTFANGQSYTSGGLNGDVGIGARIELPIGPIRIDWGYPVMNDQWNHSSGQFNFNVGYTF